MTSIPFAFSIHPGEILHTEFMEPLGLSAYKLAKDLHISAPRVNDLVRGKRGITADTALRLSRYFGNSAQFWIGLQSGHDLWVAAKSKSIEKVKLREQAATLDYDALASQMSHVRADRRYSREERNSR